MLCPIGLDELGRGRANPARRLTGSAGRAGFLFRLNIAKPPWPPPPPARSSYGLSYGGAPDVRRRIPAGPVGLTSWPAHLAGDLRFRAARLTCTGLVPWPPLPIDRARPLEKVDHFALDAARLAARKRPDGQFGGGKAACQFESHKRSLKTCAPPGPPTTFGPGWRLAGPGRAPATAKFNCFHQ